MNIAVVTGASSGIGREFVRQISAKEDYDEIWVIARREKRMKALDALTSTPLRIIPLDLTEPARIDDLRSLLEEQNPNVQLLINAAGFGKMGIGRQVSMQDMDDMINLNCRALVDVTTLVLPYMREGARILEMSSSSAFQALPGLNVYAASKAFVLRYSRGLRWELFSRGINVTAVCPYWVKDTEFIGISKQTKNSETVRHFPLASHARPVVSRALRDSKLGLAVSTPSAVSCAQRVISKILPQCAVIALWEILRRV